MSNPNVIIHGRDPENRHFAIRTDDQGYLETRTVSETPVASIVYDLELISSDLYADSQNFSAGTDPYGRNGWYGVNTATTGGSNCYWYSNTEVPQNPMTKAQIECAYNIIALDRVEPAIVLPFVKFYSAPTGINDQRPGFAHSIWTYTIPSNARLNAGETVMLVAGLSNKITNIRPEVRRVILELTGEAGECGENELIDYISLNTDSGEKPEIGSIQYLLQNAGFFYTETGKTTDYVFSNSIDRKIKDALSSTDNGGLNVNIVGGGGGGSGGLVQIQGYGGTGWVNITATSGALNTNDSATTSLDGKINNATEVDVEAIKVYTVNGGSSSSTIQAVLPSAPTVAVPLSATSYSDGTYTHYPLETFDNTLNSKIFNATETDVEAIKVYTVNPSGGGSGGLVQIQGLTTGTDYEDIHATLNGTTYSLDSNITNASLDVHCFGSSNGTDFHHLKTNANGVLKTHALVEDSDGNHIGSTVVNTVRGLNVNVVGNTNLGSRGNIYTGTLTTAQISTAVAINNEYGNNSVLTYQDASTTSTAFINIQASVDGTNFVVIGTLQPANVLSGARTAFANLKLKAFTHIRIQSSASTSLIGVVCSLFSS